MSFLFHYYSEVEFVILLFLGTCAGAAADIIKRRRAKGSVVVGEVIPAALVCEGSSYWNKSWSHAAAHVCSPPLRYFFYRPPRPRIFLFYCTVLTSVAEPVPVEPKLFGTWSRSRSRN